MQGLRKMGIGIAGIGAISLKEPSDFKIALIIAIVTVVGIVCQCILDWRKHD